MTLDEALETFSFTKGSKALRKMAQQTILPSEDVQYALDVMCLKEDGENECIFIITQRRVLCCSRKLFSKELSQIPLNSIQGVQIKGKKLGSKELHIEGLTETIILVSLLNTLEKVQYAIQWVLENQDRLNRSTEEPEQQSIQISVENEETEIEKQIRALKRLLDDSLLTQEEFDAKKKQLLGL